MKNITVNLTQTQVHQAIQEWIIRNRQPDDISDRIQITVIPVTGVTPKGNLYLNGMRVQLGDPGSFIQHPDAVFIKD